MLGTYTGKLLRINLSTGEIKVEDIPEEYLRKYIGGRGLDTISTRKWIPKLTLSALRTS